MTNCTLTPTSTLTSAPDFQSTLDRLAAEITTGCRKRPTVIGADKWVLASGLQKSIRRGEVNRAASFAYSLAMQDRRMLWRRLLVTTFEDVGLGNVEVVQEVVAAYKAPSWRRIIGDIEVAVHLAMKMAGSVKSRYLTEMVFYSDLATGTAKARQCVTKASSRKLGTILLGPDKPAHERFLALWGLAGTKAYPAKGFSRIGDMQAATTALRKLPIDPTLTESCISVLRDTPYPLALFLPLAMHVLKDEQPHFRVQTEQPLSTLEFEGVPLFAVDALYTRVGISSVRQLQKIVIGLKGFTPAQLGETLFFIEAENIDRRLTSDTLDQFRRDSIEALMLDLGLEWDEYQALRRCLVKHFDLYNDIRVQQLERSLYGVEKDLFSEARG